MPYSSLKRRRQFLKATAAGGLVAMLAGCKRGTPPATTTRTTTATATPPAAAAFSLELPPLPAPSSETRPATAASAATPKISLTTGTQRSDNIARALKPLENDLRTAIGGRRIILKPNTPSPTNQLASTHADALLPLLDLLQSLGKLPYTAIAQSSAGIKDAFHNFGYDKLAAKYNVKLIDLDQHPSETIMAFSQADARPHPLRVSSIIKDQSRNFIISVTPPKTHDRALVALGHENVVFGAALLTGPSGQPDNKAVLYGAGPRAININLAALAPMLRPSLTVIDGFQGMEGDGPLNGTPVDHRIALASLDFLAADVIATSLMGFNPADIGYLYFLSLTNLGVVDAAKMEILGEPIAKLTKPYKLHSTAQQQLQWKNNARVLGV